jgi:hypothetical protein
MEEENKNICEKCNKTFSNKYTLKNHSESKICERKTNCNSSMPTIPIKCSSTRCKYQTQSRSDIQKHLKTCKYIEIDSIVYEINKEHKKEIENYQIEIGNLNKEHKKEIEIFSKDIERMTLLLEKAICKPIFSTTNNTTNNIRGNNNNLQNILANPDLYKKQVDPDRIKNINHEIIEEHFWLGQKGLARLCVDHIIKTSEQDGNKYLLRCTDPSRKRFKYIDTTNKIAEDMEARNFISLVSIPIKTVCRDIYDKIVKKLDDDKKDTSDVFDLDFLDSKTTMAHQKFSEINDITDHSRNSEYKNEMSILLND